MSKNLGLMNKDDTVAALLKSVGLEARIEGLLLTIKMRQRYVNTSQKTIEAVYTFPGGWGSHLLGFSVEINDQRLSALAMPKKQAEQKYEKAIESGDTPVMLEMSDRGLYTANLGNLKSGEEAVIEIEYAQMLKVEHGQVRVTIPTVIGKRYGDQEQQSQLKSHQQISSNALIEYPLSVKIEIMGDLAKGTVSCPSHPVNAVRTDKGQSVQLLEGAYLDRDVVLNLEGIASNSFVVAAPDGDAYAMIASFCPQIPKTTPKPMFLKILVDCSGSMEGESIEQVRVAMSAMTQYLTEWDHVSYSKFGSEVEHVTPKMAAVTEKFIKKVLAKAIVKTDANLGGTNMQSALKSTYQIPSPSDFKDPVNVLLITDGDVWGIESLIKESKKYGHRVFAIGVGSAPAESLLRELAQRTGGACELVTPNESIEEATLRMIQRMRSVPTEKIELNWSGGVEWRSFLPHQIFSDETVHVFARVQALPTSMPILSYQVGGIQYTCEAGSLELQSSVEIARICAADRVSSTQDEKLATELALKYQLPSKYTHLILVHERAEDDKAEGLPVLERIEQMQAAGWGGFGKTVRFSRSQVFACRSMASPVKFSDMAVPSVWRTNRVEAASKVREFVDLGTEDYEIPAFLKHDSDGGTWFRKSPPQVEIEIDKGFTPKKIIDHFNKAALTNQDLRSLINQISTMMRDSTVWHLISDDERLGIEDEIERYWCVMLNWLSESLGGECQLERHAQRLLNTVLNLIDPLHKEAMENSLKNEFKTVRESSWGTGPAQSPSLKDRVKKILNIN